MAQPLFPQVVVSSSQAVRAVSLDASMASMAMVLAPAGLKTHKTIVQRFILEVELGLQDLLRGCTVWFEALRQLNPGVAARFLSDVRVYVRLCNQLAHVKSRPNAFSSFVDDPNHHGPAAAITISKWACRYGKRDCDDPLHEPILALGDGLLLVPGHTYAVVRNFRRERKRLRIA